MPYQKKYSYFERVDYYGSRYLSLRSKEKLTKSEKGQLLYSWGYLSSFRPEFYNKNFAENEIFRNGLKQGRKAQKKAYSVKF